MTFSKKQLPYLGFGLGLRPEYYEEILKNQPLIDWFEIITENYLATGGKPLYYLDKIRERYPLVMHGVSLSIGSTDPLNKDYLKQLKELAQRIQPAWISDHLCWTGINGINLHDLLPLPYTAETTKHIVKRLKAVQDYLGRQILIENVSSYLTYKESEMNEWEFISEILNTADCYLLLDLNNVYVSAQNHHFDPKEYLNALPPQRIKQIHLAGHSTYENYLIDTHDAEVIPPVWSLYEYSLEQFGLVSTMIERDDKFPPLSALLAELAQAQIYTDSFISRSKETHKVHSSVLI